MLLQMLDGGTDINNVQRWKFAIALEVALTVYRWQTATTDRIRFLLDRGADVNVRGGQYGSPLQAACCKMYEF